MHITVLYYNLYYKKICVCYLKFAVLHESFAAALNFYSILLLGMFGVYVNFKMRTFLWSAVQICGEMELGKGGGERQLL